ncbi:hypothetical protein [Nocardioides sp. TF02-7]|uniref:hypothetical protein n=1 Tax=Nocardioides sp. TF02-7 TaxID=2917724 RepID=UPI001F059434|nr:hypothetical protein [Nocardioides sp. TF02-7]UMG93559.1 hypothetical protein MF408_05040 [Nocardioides sp. TF02-7]
MTPSIDITTDRLHRAVLDLVTEHGPQHPDWLAARARKVLRDARVTDGSVLDAVAVSTVLMQRPDGTVDQVLALLDDNVLTHRVRARTGGRTDLWLGVGVQPLLNVTAFRSIPLLDGSGSVGRPESGHEVLVGPPGWLPDVDRYELVGLRITGGRLSVEPVAEDDLATPEQQLQVRRMVSSIYQVEKQHHWPKPLDVYEDELLARPELVALAIARALLEDPALFVTPYPPLDELLHNPLNRDVDLDHWRDVAVGQQIETLGFWVDGFPPGLHMELEARARRYGMTTAQFIVALLGTLAWRTPFAEDMEPWDDWDPDRQLAKVSNLTAEDEQ